MKILPISYDYDNNDNDDNDLVINRYDNTNKL